MRAVKGMRVFVITFHAYKERLVHLTFKQITAYKEFHFAASSAASRTAQGEGHTTNARPMQSSSSVRLLLYVAG